MLFLVCGLNQVLGSYKWFVLGILQGVLECFKFYIINYVYLYDVIQFIVYVFVIFVCRDRIRFLMIGIVNFKCKGKY